MTELQFLQILGLKDSDKSNFQKIKAAFARKMRSPNVVRAQRSLYNQAYEYLGSKLVEAQIPADQKPLILAICKGDLETVKKIIHQDPKMVNYRNKVAKYSLVYLATRSGHYDILQFILKSGCNLDFSSDRSTPMHCAAFYGHQHLIPLLFKYGIPTNIKNFANNIPQDEASTQSILALLKSSSQDIYYKLVQSLIDKKIAVGTLNMCLKSEKKINAKKNKDYVDAFHGTKFDALESIAKNGLRRPGQKVDGVEIGIRPGHIPKEAQIRGVKNWGQAIFLSPSIYYAANTCYSKLIFIEGECYCPIVQVKLRKNAYTSHEHTFSNYILHENQPQQVQYRVKSNYYVNQTEILRTQNHQSIKVVAILLVRRDYLEAQTDFNATTKLIIESPEEKAYKEKNKHLFE